MEVIKGTNAWSIADKEAGNDGVKKVFFQVSSKSGVGSNFKCGRNKDGTKHIGRESRFRTKDRIPILHKFINL